MRILHIGDVIGRPGRDVISAELPGLRDRLALDFVILNGENAAGGFGLTRVVANDLFACGVDVLTTGNHWLDQREILSFINDEDRILSAHQVIPRVRRAAAPISIRRAAARAFSSSIRWAASSWTRSMIPLRRWARNSMACPLGEGADAIVVDIHAEATSEKMAMGHFCDGRASLVVGTHSHIPTADAQIFPGGTAYQTDAGRDRRL